MSDDKMSRAEVKARLLSLEPAEHTYVNSIPVKRLPCAGFWFDVATCIEDCDTRYQRLRLSDAVNRVFSGYFPTMPGTPRKMQRHETCIECGDSKPDYYPQAFTWCSQCAGFVCLGCHNTHHDKH